MNDGSTDGTRDAIFALAATDSRIVGIDLARNYGHQIALSAGLEFCRDVDIAPNTGDFRLMSRRALDHLNAMPERYRFIRGMVSWIGLRQVAFPYRRHRRFAGTTHYPLRKMILLAMDAMTSFSIAPLRFASHLGLAFGLMGFLTLGYTLVSWAAGSVLPGWTSLAAIILILGSVQLMVLGIFGEYLGRMYMEAKRRPLYIVNEIAAHGAAGTEAALPVHRLQKLVKEAVRA